MRPAHGMRRTNNQTKNDSQKTKTQENSPKTIMHPQIPKSPNLQIPSHTPRLPSPSLGLFPVQFLFAFSQEQTYTPYSSKNIAKITNLPPEKHVFQTLKFRKQWKQLPLNHKFPLTPKQNLAETPSIRSIVQNPHDAARRTRIARQGRQKRCIISKEYDGRSYS